MSFCNALFPIRVEGIAGRGPNVGSVIFLFAGKEVFPIQDGLAGDISVLAAKSVLDLVIVCVMAASMGKGCIFSFIPVGLLQGSVTALSLVLKP
ncbi:MAG: DUF554 family protein, partial [Lentisphaeria bacterium]|nr:DUF554 family protein [Lentisphaeria bacterium]